MLTLKLAFKNYRREWLFSLCAIFSLAAFLVPLLTLMGVKDGIIGTLTQRLIDNPRNLEITPVSGGRFAPDFFSALAAQNDVAFVIPETRTISASVQLSGHEGENLWVGLIPTGPGDPLLAQGNGSGAGSPAGAGGMADNQIFISESAAEKLGLKVGDKTTGLVSRKREGRLESATVELEIIGLVPRHVMSLDQVYGLLSLLEMTEDYRNGFSVPALNWPGADKPSGPKSYAGFRLYARDFDAVDRLRQSLEAQGLEVYTRAEDIATVRSLDHSFTVVFLVLALVVGFGAFASASSSALDQVAKMRRSLAILRLIGFNARRLIAFSMSQAALTGLLAAVIADGLFLIIAGVLNSYFAGSLGFGERICWLAPAKLLAAGGISFVFMLAASATAGLSLSSIEPSEGMRDV